MANLNNVEVNWYAEIITIDEDLYDIMHYYLDSENPWPNLPEGGSSIFRFKINEEYTCVLNCINKNRPELTAYILYQDKIVSLIAVFTKLDDWIQLGYIDNNKQSQIYSFRLNKNYENPY